MKTVLWCCAVALTLLLAAAQAAAADMDVWVGRDVDNNKVFWTCSKAGGNDWKLKKNGVTVGDYKGVTSTSEFVELQLKGTTKYERVRLYKDRLSMNKKGSRTDWMEIAKGKWSK